MSFVQMDLPPSYEEAIKQAPNPFDTSSGGNFYRQVLTQQIFECIFLVVNVFAIFYLKENDNHHPSNVHLRLVRRLQYR